MKRIEIVGIVFVGISAMSQAAAATFYQVADTGHIASHTYSQFLSGTGGSILGQVSGYGDDAGFFYQPVLDRYFQVADTGHIVSHTYSQFLSGTGGSILGQVSGYGDDAGFFFMSDASDVPAPSPSPVPLPASFPFLAISIGAVAILQLHRAPGRPRRPD